MNGQWIGEFHGSYGGLVIVNIDERMSSYSGVAYVLPIDKAIVPSAVAFETSNKDNEFTFKSGQPMAIDPRTGGFVPWQEIASQFPGVNMSNSADVHGKIEDDTLALSWRTDIGVEGSCRLPRSRASQPSALKPLRLSWEQYKEYVSNLEGRRELFRGQRKPWRLRTAFHRTGRSDLARFLGEDIPTLYRHLSHRTKHLFDLKNVDENGAFFSLLQHHGYPTPLLDWSYSPYVAAFFAFRNVRRDEAQAVGDEDVVRIYAFDQAKWRKWNQMPWLVTAFPHASILEFLALENDRMLPQQSVSLLTNIDDVETYIIRKDETEYLTAIDIPTQERTRVMRELRYMGITAGSMFPGLDGLCEELRELHFEI